GGLAVFASLIVLRFMLGVGEAATYPVAARAIANWIPAPKHGMSSSIVIAGLSIGSAITPPLISVLMVKIGWRASFYISSSLAFLVAIVWRFYATDYPKQYPGENKEEHNLIFAHQEGNTNDRLGLV